MKEQLLLLIELQKVESEMNKINMKCRSLPEEILKLDEAFNAFQAGFEENKKKFEDIQKAHREKEEKLKKGQESIKKAKERLGDVKTNKEYQAVLKEIEGADSKNGETEDEIISVLEEVDKARVELKIKEKEMEAYRLEYGEKRNKLDAELKSLDTVLSTSTDKSGKLKKKIPAALLKQYDAIKALHKGLAVVAVWKEICAGCYMNIPPQLYIELQKSTDFYTCPNCNRIIYWQDQSSPKP
ncbi:MAG: C4-type zinc ribbon domain-containing protein [Syntrophales bacterium LBB04]|nr:C4-type zinc ribbon domain-containing protein [Syntrophales bacterium LBB04]